MTARRIDGKAAAQAIRDRVAALVADSSDATGRAPGLATVLVGEDPASAVYVRSKNRATAEAGMASFAHNLPDTTSEAELLQLVDELNADERGRRHPRPAAAAARRSTRRGSSRRSTRPRTSTASTR